MTTNLHEFRNYILDKFDSFSTIEMGGAGLQLPEFELYAQDYLEFAEQELDIYQGNPTAESNRADLLNCISHLKRAMDCQSDTFLHAFNLYKTFTARNLKSEKKLEFFAASGIITSRSLSRLNTVRNKMEHEYQLPKLTDIEVY